MAALSTSSPGKRLESRPGFTLIELLVTSSIVGMLLLLLLPAVQAARESARRIKCLNNLKQMSIACLSHHDVHGHFPTGGWGWYWTGDADRGFGKEQPGGWIFNTLPYFEQYSVYESSSDGDPEVSTRQQRVGASRVIQTPLSVINCPSRRANKTYPLTTNAGGGTAFFNSITPSKAGRSDYAANSGHAFNEWSNPVLGRGPRSYEESRTWSASHFWGGELAPFDHTLQMLNVMSGVSYERSTVSMRQVTAGLTHTYLIGERHIPVALYETGTHVGDNETWCTGFNNDNYRKTGRLLNREVVECLPVPDTATDAPEAWGRFGSAHPNTWSVAYCDGSVCEMTYDVDWRIHRDAGNRQSE